MHTLLDFLSIVYGVLVGTAILLKWSKGKLDHQTRYGEWLGYLDHELAEQSYGSFGRSCMYFSCMDSTLSSQEFSFKAPGTLKILPSLFSLGKSPSPPAEGAP